MIPVTPSLVPSANTTSSETVNLTESFLMMFGIPGIIIVILTVLVILLNIYRYNLAKRPVLPRFEPVMVTRSTPPLGSV